MNAFNMHINYDKKNKKRKMKMKKIFIFIINPLDVNAMA